MKTSIHLSFFFALLFSFSISNLVAQKFDVKLDKSKVSWKAYKVTGSHFGDINIKSGHLVFDSGILSGGEFVIDMNTINVSDISGGGKKKLENHLKSDDFFDVKNHPTSSLIFQKVIEIDDKTYKIVANMTIKGKTKPVIFVLNIDGVKASTSFKIDRTKFDIKYKSSSFFDNLKNKAIYDEFDITVNFEF